MTFLRFLSYEKPYIYLYLVGFIITAAVIMTDSGGGSVAWGTFFYAFTLTSLVLLGFLMVRYQQNLRAMRQLSSGDADSLSLEGELTRRYLDELKIQHIREMNRVHDRQNEHYDFIVSWFHEIKTPVAVLRLLQQTEMDANSLREELAKIEHYIDQALYYAKLDSFNQDYDIQNCDLLQIAKEIVKTHSKTFITKKIRIDMQAESTAVQSDPKWLQFIVNQIVTNSLKYTEHGGQITITSVVTPLEKQLLIRDSGIGISPQDLPRIFNRGFTGETGRKYTKSTGMGLYLAQQLSNKLGHYITCSSEVGVSTQFIIHFPKDEDPYLSIRQQ
ncbi:HAMP domain-containing sensor histidine kinase [Paenibacillus sp. CF384]|uniref:sensor histidine kinase n=1 Tax=Paenibacillus sp. CF384 TaxID=1884382 RepID=UPI000897AFE5|nr:sensor histidine kinase [Paenibacillus sp. CF384]SDX49645.1 Signal transduction histidine kinase [Paenibacillus sp. CF384]